MPDIRTLHAQSVEDFAALVAGVPDDAWSRPTPCSEWDVRALVNHVVGEDKWTEPLVEGRTVAEVGDRFDGDLLGRDPAGAASQAGKEAVAAFAASDALERTIHVSYGDIPGEEYAWQLFADHVIHGWDLAAATGQQPRLQAGVVEALQEWFGQREELYRQGGAVGARVDLGSDATPAQRLLAAFGRDPSWSAS